MGAANVIPGVSGGTAAFITGIYERLITALKSFDVKVAKALLSGKFTDSKPERQAKTLETLDVAQYLLTTCQNTGEVRKAIM